MLHTSSSADGLVYIEPLHSPLADAWISSIEPVCEQPAAGEMTVCCSDSYIAYQHQDAGSLLQHDHVTEPRGDNAHRRYHRRGLRRTYDWNTRSHFYPDIVDQIQDDCVFDDGVDDDDDISRCGKFYRWESGRHRNSGRRKYPRWSLCVRRLTNNHVAPASTVIHENPDIVNADKQQHCNNNYNDSHTGSISGTVSRTKAIRTPQYFRRLHYVSSSLNEKIGRKESSVGLQFGTNRKPSRRLSDSGLESAKLQAAVDDGKARVCTDRLSRDEGQTNAENKLEVVNEHAVVVRTRRRVRQSKADECRQLSNKLTSLLNTGSKTRRQFVRKRCRRLIGWDPYGGFGSEQTESTPTSTCCSGGGSADDEDDVTQGRKTEMQEKIDNSLQTGDDNSPIEPIAVDRILTTTSADGDCHDDAASRPHQNVFDYPQPCDDEPSQCHRHNENETNTSDGDSSRREAHTPDVLHIGGGVETPSSNIDAEHETRNTLITGPRRLWDEMRSRERIIGTDHRPPGHDYDYVLYKISNNLRQHTTAEFSNHSPNTRRSLDNVVRKGHRAHERRRLRSCANSSAEDAKVQNSNKGSDSERADQLHIDGDRLSSNGRCMNWRTFDRFTDQISNLVNDGTEAVDCQIVDRHIDDDDAAAAAAADDDAEKNFINGSLIHSGLTSPTFKCDGHRFTEDVGDNQQVSDYAHFEGDFEINETRDDRLKASAIYPSDDNSLGNLSLSTRDWNESPAFSCGMSKRRCVERIVPDDCHQRRYPDCQAHDRREQKLKPDVLSKATFDQCFGWREDQSSDVRRVDSAEPSRVKQISYDHNVNINPSLPCDTFTRSPRMTMASNEEYQDVPAVGRETTQRATVFTVTGFPVPLQETRAATHARKQEQNFGIRRDNNVVGIDRTSAPWNTASALIQSEKPVTRLTDNGKIIRHNDDDWQRIENALDSDRRRRYFYVTERIIRGESQRLPHAYFHPCRHHHHQLPHPSTTMSQSTEAPPACLKLMSSRDDGNDRDVMRPITRGEDRLEYELPAVACCINASSLDAASTIVSRHDVLTSDKPMNQTERNSGGQTQNTKEHGPDDSSEAQSGFEFPKITELLWTLPCPRPPKNNAMTTSAKLPTRTFAVSGITQKNDGKRDGSRRQPTSISRDNDESREREGNKGVQINSSYAEGSFRQAQNSDRPQDKGDVKRNVAQLSADRIGVDRCHPSKNTTLMRGQDDSACADRQVTCKQFKVTIFGQRQMKDRRVDANETAAKKATTHREEQFERLTNSLAAMRYIDDDDDEVSATCNSVTHINDVKRSVTGFQPFSFGSESCPELRSSSDDMLPPVGRKRRVRFTLREKRAPQCGAVIPSTSQDDGDLTVTAGCRITRSRKCAKPDDQDTPVNYLWNQIIRSDGRCNATNASQREASGTAAATGISKLKNVNKSVEKTALTSSQSVDLLFDLLSADYKLRSSSTGSISSLNDHLSNPPQWNSRAERKRVSQYQVIDDSQVHLERNRPVSSINSTGVTPVLRIGDMQPPNDRSRSNDNDDDFASHEDDDGCRRKSIKELVESFEEMSMPLFKVKAKN